MGRRMNDPEFQSVAVHKLHVELFVKEHKLKEWYAEACPDHPEVAPLRFINADGSIGARCGNVLDYVSDGIYCERTLTTYVAVHRLEPQT